MPSSIKVGIVGLGMVGGPLARYFEEIKGRRRGEDLFLYDVNPAKGCSDDINLAGVIFACVPTPQADNGKADVSAVDSVFQKLASPKIVVIKSTVPPGTTDFFQRKYSQHQVLFNPEFLTEAKAWENTISPDRQLVGWTRESRDEAAKVLALLPQAPLSAPSDNLELSATEAEIIKYAANMFLTRKVTFANAIFDISSHHGADYEKIRAGIAADSRIGPSHLDVHHQGYRGYGGYCFVKDTEGLIAHCRECGLERAEELFAADRDFNNRVLAEQGLTSEDVSVHDHEWIQKKMQNSKIKIQNDNTKFKPQRY